MLRPDERAAIEAFMGETKKIDEYKRALAVVTLDAGNPLNLVGLSIKHVQRIRREFRSVGVGAFKDKRHNNKPVLLTRAQQNEVLVMLGSTTPNDHRNTNVIYQITVLVYTHSSYLD